MVQTCSKCSRANPGEAVYCYFDGFVLGGHGRNGGPVAVGAQTFRSPFVFPTGRTCRNFDELALACQEDWGTARDLLRQGYVENFLGGVGRGDLARAARHAARNPDADRGLDELLSKLPSDSLAEPRLRVEPQEVNLGILSTREDRAFDLRLDNQGMRLLYGTVSCADANSSWLALGAAGADQKHVQFGHELVLPVHVVGNRLRASNKPVEGHLVVETNGGTITVVVRAEVPVKPFPPGVLGGAKSPRQVAEKAKANPKEAAVLFEKGAVAEWYKENGWTYPVQGPSASGLGAVQQFFEALGLTPPPRVEISTRAIQLQGTVGEQLGYRLEVKTEEKRPVYAHAVSNQPWLEVGRPKLKGRVATINLSVPAVPDREGETLRAQLVVRSNGNQRFVVPVTLEVGGSLNFGAPTPAPVHDIKAPTPVGLAPPPLPSATPAVAPSSRRRVIVKQTPTWLHALPALLLAAALLAVVVWDRATRPTEGGGEEPPFVHESAAGARSWESWTYHIEDREPLLGVQFSPESNRFGLVMLKEHDPTNRDRYKKLTFKEDGETNNTCVRVDGEDYLFGKLAVGVYWVEKNGKLPNGRIGRRSVMRFPGDVKVTQHVEIVPGEQSGEQVPRLDTCLVYYTVENTGTVDRKVGLRVMLDTFIGANDGVPLAIPGPKGGLVKDMRDFSEKEIPDYVEALEKPDLKNPGTVAHLGLKGIRLPGAQLEPLHRMFIGKWQRANIGYYLDAQDKESIDGVDSCVWLYWAEQKMRPREKREMAFTYGLGKIAIEGDARQQMGLTKDGDFHPGGEFTVMAYVMNAREGQKVKLELPEGLSLVEGEQPEKALSKGAEYSQVSWRVRSSSRGVYTIKATSEGAQATTTVRIKTEGIFN